MAIILVCGAVSGGSQETGTAQAGRQAALEYVRILETNPDSDEAKQAAARLTAWLVAVPDLTVKPCPAILGPEKKRKRLPANLKLHPMFSQAAYQIEHPDAGPADLAVYLAGVEGTLRTYEAMREMGKKKQYRLLEELLVLEEEGRLEAYVGERMAECFE